MARLKEKKLIQKINTNDFTEFADRLWKKDELHNISQYAESEAIRQRDRSLLKA